MIEFPCGHCGARLKTTEKNAGRTQRCPACKASVVVPTTQTSDPAYDADLLDVMSKGEIPSEAASPPPLSDELAEGLSEPQEPVVPQETGPTNAPRLPWPIDAILYPVRWISLIHLAALWLLMFYVCPHVMALGFGTEFIPFIYLFPVAYTLYYLADCVRDRAAGGRHMPDYWMHPTESSKWDCVTQMFDVVGCIAVCFCPTSVYYVARERVDWIYLLLLTIGGLFFPMVLLAVVLFDSLSALNPLLILGSILRTFVPYCVLVLLLAGISYLSVSIGYWTNSFHPLPTKQLLLWLVQFYLVFVAIALLGGFYQRHETRLDWEV